MTDRRPDPTDEARARRNHWFVTMVFGFFALLTLAGGIGSGNTIQLVMGVLFAILTVVWLVRLRSFDEGDDWGDGS